MVVGFVDDPDAEPSIGLALADRGHRQVAPCIVPTTKGNTSTGSVYTGTDQTTY